MRGATPSDAAPVRMNGREVSHMAEAGDPDHGVRNWQPLRVNGDPYPRQCDAVARDQKTVSLTDNFLVRNGLRINRWAADEQAATGPKRRMKTGRAGVKLFAGEVRELAVVHIATSHRALGIQNQRGRPPRFGCPPLVPNSSPEPVLAKKRSSEAVAPGSKNFAAFASSRDKLDSVVSRRGKVSPARRITKRRV